MAKQVILIISKDGNVDKSGIANRTIYAARSQGHKVAVLDGDSKNEFSTYKKYSLKDEAGDLLEDDMFNGAMAFDIEDNPKTIFDASDIDADIVVIDVGANKIEKALSAVRSQKDFFAGYDDAELAIMVPISNEKCISTLDYLAKSVLQVPKRDMSRPVKLVAVFNEGYMETQGGKILENTTELYENSKALADMKINPSHFILREVRQSAMFDTADNVKLLLKEKPLADVIATMDDLPKTERFILKKYIRDADDLFNATI